MARLLRRVQLRGTGILPVAVGTCEVKRVASEPQDEKESPVDSCDPPPEDHSPKVESIPYPHGRDARATTDVIHVRQGAHLPHWTRVGDCYAVTFCLADALPREALILWRDARDDIVTSAQRFNRALTDQERRRLAKLHSERVDSYLDAGHGASWLRRAEVAQIVKGALTTFDTQKYELLAWCVVPNHVHAILTPLRAHSLDRILHTWKSFSASRANRALQRTGPFWQVQSYDHLIRDEQDFAAQIQYVLENPAQAHLRNWPWFGRGTGILPVAVGTREAKRVASGPKSETEPPTRAHNPPPDGRPPRGRSIARPHGQDARAT